MNQITNNPQKAQENRPANILIIEIGTLVTLTRGSGENTQDDHYTGFYNSDDDESQKE